MIQRDLVLETAEADANVSVHAGCSLTTGELAYQLGKDAPDGTAKPTALVFSNEEGGFSRVTPGVDDGFIDIGHGDSFELLGIQYTARIGLPAEGKVTPDHANLFRGIGHTSSVVTLVCLAFLFLDFLAGIVPMQNFVTVPTRFAEIVYEPPQERAAVFLPEEDVEARPDDESEKKADPPPEKEQEPSPETPDKEADPIEELPEERQSRQDLDDALAAAAENLTGPAARVELAPGPGRPIVPPDTSRGLGDVPTPLPYDEPPHSGRVALVHDPDPVDVSTSTRRSRRDLTEGLGTTEDSTARLPRLDAPGAGPRSRLEMAKPMQIEHFVANDPATWRRLQTNAVLRSKLLGGVQCIEVKFTALSGTCRATLARSGSDATVTVQMTGKLTLPMWKSLPGMFMEASPCR